MADNNGGNSGGTNTNAAEVQVQIPGQLAALFSQIL
jgi:hypothetical protein